MASWRTTPENARLYFKFRPTRLRLGADPELTTHRAYGLPRPASTPEFMKTLESMRINPTANSPSRCRFLKPRRPSRSSTATPNNQTDKADMERQWPQLKGQFLIDRDGIVRWANVECAVEGLAGVGKFPSDEEILTAVRALPH